MIVVFPSLAAADWRLRVTASVARPALGPTDSVFGWGGGGDASVEWSIVQRLGLQTRLGFVGLSPYAGRTPQGVAQPSLGTLAWWSVGGRVRLTADVHARGSEGLWLDASAGGAWTGDRVRPMVELRAGVGIGGPSLGAGVFVGYMRIFDVGPSAIPGDTSLVIAGMEFGFASPARADALAIAPAPRAPPPRAQPNVCAPAAHVLARDDDHDGCPDADRDIDGIADRTDACPAQPEDVDGFRDADGCPDADNDDDHIADAFDACPNVPEVINGVDDDDGCPDEAHIQVASGRITLDSTMLRFEFNSTHFVPGYESVITDVSRILRAHAEYGRVYIEGHSDDFGSELYNFNLSFHRAAAVVVALRMNGVPRGRLVALGFGRGHPIAEGSSRPARARNRRVEIVVDGHRTSGRARTARGWSVIADRGTTP